MASIGDLFFTLRGDDKQLVADSKKAGDKAGAGFAAEMKAKIRKSWSGGEIGKGLIQGFGLAGGLGAANLFAGAISKVTDALGDSVEAALADEESVNRLGASLRANVPNWDGQTDAIEQNIKAKQRLGFEDETLRDSLTVLVGATHDVTKAQEIMNTAMDLARFKGIDLRTASEALIKVEGGVYRSLKQLGIKLKDNATSTEALAAVQAVASGQAEAFAQTNRGKLLASQIALDEAMENFGTKIMPIAVEAMTTGAEIATDFADALAGIGENATNNEDPLQNLANLLHDMFKSPEEEARTFFGTLFDGLDDIQEGLANAGQAAHDWLTFWDSSDEVLHKAANAADHTADSVEGLKGSAVNDLHGVSTAMDTVGDASGQMAEDIEEDTKAVVVTWDDMRKKLLDDANDLIDDAFDPLIERDRLAATNAELAAARRVIASGKASKAEIRDARDTLNSASKAQAESLLKLAEAGTTNSKTYAHGIRDLKTNIKNAVGPAKTALQAILDKIREVERTGRVVPINIRVSGGGGSGLSPGGKAAGGPVQANVPYWVGERGPELVVPGAAGTVIPHAESMALASMSGPVGGTTNIAVQLPVGPAPDPFETADALRWLNDFGMLSKPRSMIGG